MSNRLADETSPYLLQHADNPVEWYTWGEEALERARGEDRPILLSIGYSSCHWCHVMAHESFEDPATARLMNEHFVNVKVDREERPDLDSIYMSAVQGMTGRGGWPLTVFLTPEGVPFYGGTYFPPESRQGLPSFREVLGSVASAWEDRREEVERNAEELRSFLRRSVAPGAGSGEEEDVLSPSLLEDARRACESRYDDAHGGFGSAPKFPQPLVLEFLLREAERTGRERPLQMVADTLEAMARGGIRDHLAGGFHRYAVDGRWLVPHFEKMLYDNALLARVYTQAWQATGRESFREVAAGTVAYLLDDLRGPEGGFYSARDADSEGEEGRHYVWTPEEIDEVLDPGAARLVKRFYDVTPEGNFEGRSILHVAHDPETVARAEGIDAGALRERLAAAREALLEARRRREEPLRDEKVLAAWNGLALRTLAEAGFALGREEWLREAGRTADFLLDVLRPEGPDGGLLHVWTAGEAKIEAFLDDHAALGGALLSLWEVTGEGRWLGEARRLSQVVVERFWDADVGAFYDVAGDGGDLVVRPRDETDRAVPSGTALAVELLLRTAAVTGEDRWREPALRALRGAAARARRHPLAYGRLLSAASFHLGPPTEVVVLGPREAPETGALLDVLRRRWLPNRVLAVLPTGDAGDAGEVESPLVAGKEPVDGRATAFVCRNYACREPVTDPGALEEQLDAL